MAQYRRVLRMQTHLPELELPDELVQEIDKTIGADRRNAFLADSARVALDRRRDLLACLQSDKPAWKDEDHPELVALGTAGWVRSLRQESERRLERIHAPERTED